MSIMPIVLSPDPILKQVSSKVEKVDDETKKLMDDMLKTMYNASGIGLAAVQVGILKRVVVMDVNYESEEHNHHDHHKCDGVHVKNTKPLYLVNPEIVQKSSNLSSYDEGCLSFPTMNSKVTRPQEVTVNFLDYDGKEQTIQVDGIMATCIQHEIDHLNGVTFVDHISRLKRDVILKKMKKLHSNN